MNSGNNNPYAVSEIELVYKSQPDLMTRPKVLCADDAFKVLQQTWDNNKIDFVEQSKIILLDRAKKVLGIFDHSTGWHNWNSYRHQNCICISTQSKCKLDHRRDAIACPNPCIRQSCSCGATG